MNNLPDEDPKLLNFLRQNRSIAPLESPDLEDRLMSEIDFIPVRQSKVTHDWRRYIAGAIGIIATGMVGVGIDRLMNPPEPSMAQLQQLNLFLEAHTHSLVDIDTNKELVDSDTELLLETDIEADSVDG
jgi:hypothetical protein